MRSLLRRILRQPDLSQTPVPRRRRLEVEAGRPIYAIGDVHGCLSALLALEERIAADARRLALARPLIVYLGDYVDRGPESRAVLDHLARSDHADRIERIALCGNHDDTFLRFLASPRENMGWLDFGGDATLHSYGLDPATMLSRKPGDVGRILRETVPAHHVGLLENLPVALVCGDLLFVHAGVRPGIAFEEQDDEDLLWIREPFLSEGPRLPLTVVHGHTAGNEPVFGKGRVCIDTGCYATGRLTAIRITPDGSALL